MASLSCYVLAIAVVVSPTFAQQYFPVGALTSDRRMDHFKSEWYSEELAAIDERSLWQVSREQPDSTTYRFLWLRSFHLPICVRLTINKDESGSLICKQGNVHGAIGHKKLTWVQTKPLSASQVKLFLDRLASVGFWRLPGPNSDSGGTDGAQWILEGTHQGRYKVVDVWSPPATDPIHVLGAMLVFDLAQIRVPSNAIY